MKYIFISFSGLSLPVAYKLQQEGNEVVVGQIEDMKDYVMEEETKKALNILEQLSKTGETLDLRDFFCRFTLDSFGK